MLINLTDVLEEIKSELNTELEEGTITDIHILSCRSSSQQEENLMEISSFSQLQLWKPISYTVSTKYDSLKFIVTMSESGDVLINGFSVGTKEETVRYIVNQLAIFSINIPTFQDLHNILRELEGEYKSPGFFSEYTKDITTCVISCGGIYLITVWLEDDGLHVGDDYCNNTTVLKDILKKYVGNLLQRAEKCSIIVEALFEYTLRFNNDHLIAYIPYGGLTKYCDAFDILNNDDLNSKEDILNFIYYSL